MFYFQMLGILALIAAGIGAGRLFSKFKKPWWGIGYALPLSVLFGWTLGNRVIWLAFHPPIQWIMIERTGFVLLAFSIPMLFTLLVPRLKTARERRMVTVLAAVFTVYFGILPFVMPYVYEGAHRRLITQVSVDGICHQTTDYTCGPAACVSALRKLGFPAEEGELAILAHTCPTHGTLNDCLRAALVQRYGSQGLVVEYRPFSSIQELRAAGITVAVTKFSFFIDHFVTVLQVTDDKVILADPAAGKRELTHAEFQAIWRNSGITLSRQPKSR